MRVKLLVDNLEPYIFRKVSINFQTPTRILKQAIFLEDTMATMEEAGFLYVSLGNLTSNVQRIKDGTLLGTTAPVVLVHQASPQVTPEQQPGNKSAPIFFKVYEEINIDTSSEYTSSFEFEILSSTDPSEPGLSEREFKKCTDPALLAPIPCPEALLDEIFMGFERP